MHEIFVNYRTNDAHDAAFAIQADLAHRFGPDKVFFASRSLKHDEPFPEAMIREAGKARVLLAVIGPDWLKRDHRGHRLIDDEADWVRKEIAAALHAGTAVIPVLVGRKTERLPADLPPDVKDLVNFNYCRFDHREAEGHLSQIATAVQEVVTGLVDATQTKSEPAGTSGTVISGNQSGRVITITGDHNSDVHMVGDQHGETNYGGAINTGGGTFIGSSRGPIHTGTGAQFNVEQAHREDPDDEK